MIIKILCKKDGQYNYYCHKATKTFKENVDKLKEIVKATYPKYLILQDNDKYRIINPNRLKVIDNLVEINSSISKYLPNCFIQEKDFFNWKPDANDIFFFENYNNLMDSANNLTFPLIDFRSICLFFKDYFKKYEITEEKFESYLYCSDFDYEQPMIEYGETEDFINFIQNQIEYMLNLLVLNMSDYNKNMSKTSRVNTLKGQIGVNTLKNEIDFLRRFIVDAKVEENNQEDNYRYGDKYDFGPWNK